jgi:hypothetical protein
VSTAYGGGRKTRCSIEENKVLGKQKNNKIIDKNKYVQCEKLELIIDTKV